MAKPKVTLKSLKNQAGKELKSVSDVRALEEVFRAYLGKKGELTQILRSLSKLSKAERLKVGKEANEVRNFLKEEFDKRQRELRSKEVKDAERDEWIDVTAPGKKIPQGHLHPLTQIQRKVQEIFQGMGFSVIQGPEVESEWYNFDALNIPPDHPARDLWDTFWLKPENSRMLLRTHTSPVQIRYMEKYQPPLRIIVPGRVFRYEATDAHHEFDLYQLEGLMVGVDISAANFKAVIQEFYQRFFEKPVNIRLRPSYFPFVEPGFEVDMSCILCGGKGCSGCGHSGWLEMMGAGMVHPNVFKAVKYNPKNWQGFAFGMGLDRLAMMKFKIGDIRLFRSGDLRFLRQF
ncbi:phenylalanine--tRNA ligase subunit alpha [Patescibacteria group bacterium]|nr:phenylalanine--tRNA ligase subunit alpha [Patescibacteria group bacterium]